LIVIAVAVGLAAAAGCKRSSGTVIIKDPGPSQRQEALRLIDLAIKAEKAGDSPKAIRLYQESLAQSQDLAIAWHNLAMLFVKRGDVGDQMKAVELLKNAVALEPEQARSYYCIGYIYDNNGQPEKAMEYFRQALEKDRLHLPSLRGVAKVGKALFIADRESLDWMKTALLLEKDPAWRRVFEDEKFRIDSAIQNAGNAGKF
jgi:tetratricopeptide (TPR) repeat protein